MAADVYVALLAVLLLVGAVRWSRPRAGRRLWIADDAGVTAGLETEEAPGRPVRVSGLYAVPQGRGHAGSLTKELLAWADREGVTLALRVFGAGMRQRYEAAGFRPDPHQRGLARHLLPRLLREPGAGGAPTAPGLRGLAAVGIGPSLAVASAAAVGVVSGSYWLIGRIVAVDPAAVLSPAQRLTGAFAAATAVGAVVALTLRTRRQDLDEQLARREIAAAFTERFRAASTQLGGKAAAERLAGVYAMAALADEYPQHRQQCVDVLCGYLRLPFDPSADDIEAQMQIITATLPDGTVRTSHTTPARRPHDQVARETILRLIRDHTTPHSDPSWSSLDFNLAGAHLTNVDFQQCKFDGEMNCARATFTGDAGFRGATFSGDAGFGGATFLGDAWFGGAAFSGDAGFGEAAFSGDAGFGEATFSGVARFGGASFSGDARFGGASFSGDARFGGASFSGDARFERAAFSGHAWFGGASFSGDAGFGGASFSGVAGFGKASFSGHAGFGKAAFSGDARFGEATFSHDARFERATFSGVAGFGGASFSGVGWFGGASFSGDAGFGGATFSGVAGFGGATFSGDAWFGGASFSGDARFERAAFSGHARFERATFSGDARFSTARFASSTFDNVKWLGGRDFDDAHFERPPSGLTLPDDSA